jgi:oxygen-dependent protoporphyrinogen oxidase
VSTQPSQPPRIVIIGGGISGLATAYFLEKAIGATGAECGIDLIEGRNRLGGVILTERRGDFLLEGGPDSFLSLKPAAIELCRELGLSDQLVPSNDERRKTYVLERSQLRELPEGLMFVVPTRVWPVFRSDLLSLAGKMRLALSPFLPPVGRGKPDCSVAEFISRRFGNEVLERLAEPLLAAVYGADVDKLSARAALPQLIGLEEKYGNLWRGMSHARSEMADRKGSRPPALFMTLRNGVGEMVSALEKRLTRTRVATNCEIRRVLPGPAGAGYRVEWSGGETDAAAVIVATPAPAAGRLLRDLDAPLAEQLAAIPYHSSVIVALAYEQRAMGRELEGFGFVVPRTEKKNLVACTWVSTKFPFRSAPGGVLLRCFLGGARNPAILEETDERIVEAVLREVAEVMQVSGPPLFTQVYRWEGCMPQYSVGHAGRLEAIARRLADHAGLFLAGNAYRGVGIPDCIQSGSLAAAAALDSIRSRR